MRPRRARCFASLQQAHSAALDEQQRRPGGEACSLALFREMSRGKTRVSEQDVRLFARSHGLPEDYAASFFASLQKSADFAQTKGIPFQIFDRFVKSREEALHRTFDALDASAHSHCVHQVPGHAAAFIKCASVTRSVSAALSWLAACCDWVACITLATRHGRLARRKLTRTSIGNQTTSVHADKDGQISREELRIGLAHLMIKCPTSRCCYRTCPACIDPAVAAMAQSSDKVDFCRFRRFFLLLSPDKMVVEYWLRAGDPACCDVRCSTAPYDAQRRPNASPWGHLFAGAVAGAVSRTVTAPFETLRLMAMTSDTSAAGGILAAGALLVQQQGWRALYCGNGINVARSAPQKALDFFAFDALKQRMARPRLRGGANSGSGSPGEAATAAVNSPKLRAPPRQCPARPAPEGAAPQLGPMATLSAAGLAGVVSTIVLHPLEVLRTRLSTDSGAAYRSMPRALRSLAKTEGIPALYRHAAIPRMTAACDEAVAACAVPKAVLWLLVLCPNSATGARWLICWSTWLSPCDGAWVDALCLPCSK